MATGLFSELPAGVVLGLQVVANLFDMFWRRRRGGFRFSGQQVTHFSGDSKIGFGGRQGIGDESPNLFPTTLVIS